jgi:hypothetical protein
MVGLGWNYFSPCNCNILTASFQIGNKNLFSRNAAHGTLVMVKPAKPARSPLTYSLVIALLVGCVIAAHLDLCMWRIAPSQGDGPTGSPAFRRGGLEYKHQEHQQGDAAAAAAINHRPPAATAVETAKSPATKSAAAAAAATPSTSPPPPPPTHPPKYTPTPTPALIPAESAARGPFTKPASMDLIVTWLNSSAPGWLAVANGPGGSLAWSDYDKGFKSKQPYNPRHHDLSTNFVELKYCLRSLEKHGLMKYIRKIHIVHSDLYAPPNYLKKDHPRLQFVPHSVTFAHLPADVRAKGLPTFSRTSIDSQLQHIPGLADWFLRLDDDFFMTNTLVKTDFWKAGKIQVHGGTISPVAAPCVRGSDTYIGPMQVAACLLGEKFGSKKRRYTDHAPVMGFRPAIEEMEKLWAARFKATASRTEDDPADIFWSAFTTMYMVDTGRAEHSGKSYPPNYAELHTNANSYCPRPCGGYARDIADSRLGNIRSFLEKSNSRNWVNLQGPGFDDAYRYRWNPKTREYSPKIEKLALAWWEKNYPRKTEFEV